jgi:hypothetical protein
MSPAATPSTGVRVRGQHTAQLIAVVLLLLPLRVHDLVQNSRTEVTKAAVRSSIR